MYISKSNSSQNPNTIVFLSSTESYRSRSPNAGVEGLDKEPRHVRSDTYDGFRRSAGIPVQLCSRHSSF